MKKGATQAHVDLNKRGDKRVFWQACLHSVYDAAKSSAGKTQKALKLGAAFK